MNRRYIAEREAKKPSNDRQLHVDRNTTINEALDIFVRAKEAEGVRPGTVRNYRSVVRYLQDCLVFPIYFSHSIRGTRFFFSSGL